MSRRRLATLAAMPLLLLAAPMGRAQAPQTELVSFVVRATAVGVTARESSVGLLPAGTDVVVASSSLAEAELTTTSAIGLAALPYPTDQVLSAPGAAAGLGGIPAPPGYPLVARADHPFTPDASATPEGQPGATVTAHAEADRAVATADGPASAAPSAGLGLPPEAGDVVLSVGQVRTRAEAVRSDDGSLQVRATTQMSDVALLGGAFRAANVTAVATLVLRDGRAEPGPGEVSVTGATLGGSPVGITSEGLVLGPQSVALAPVATSISDGLEASGITLVVTPSTSETDGPTARVSSGSLRLRMTATARDFPLVFEIDLGAADVSTDAVVDAVSTGGVPSPASTGDAVAGPTDGVAAPDVATGAPSEVSVPPSPPAARGAGGDEPPADAFTPVAFVPLDFRPVYRWLGLLGLAVLVARYLVLRAAPRRTGPALNDLWRW